MRDFPYFDHIIDIEDFSTTKKSNRCIRLGSKSYDQVSYVFIKLFTRRNNQWRRYQEINFSLQEFQDIYEVLMIEQLDILRNLQRDNGYVGYQFVHCVIPEYQEYQNNVFDPFITEETIVEPAQPISEKKHRQVCERN